MYRIIEQKYNIYSGLKAQTALFWPKTICMKQIRFRLLKMSARVPLLFVFLILAGAPDASSQAPVAGSWRFGGGLGLSFGQDAFQIGISPSALYQANEYLGIGVGLNYTHAKFNDYKLNAWGGSLIGLATPVPFLQLSADVEELRVNRTFSYPTGTLEDSYWLPALYLGAGFATGPVTVGVRFDVLYDSDRSLYANAWSPFIRVYF